MRRDGPRWRRYLTATLLLAALGAGSSCALSRQPGMQVVSATPDSITVRAQSTNALFSSTKEASLQDVTALAEKHCDQYGKNAYHAKTHVEWSGSRLEVFDCRP
jgi:hypothetical protein